MNNPNDRIVVIRLQRRLVCRLLMLLQAAVNHENVMLHKQTWQEIRDSIRGDLAVHDSKWGNQNAV